MRDWEYSFKPITKAEWFQQIAKDIHPNSIESLQDEWWPGEPITPFHHAEDRKSIVALPDHYFSKAPLLIEWIMSTDDTKEMAQQSGNALAHGASQIVFDSFKPSVKEIFEDTPPGTIQIATTSNYFHDDVPQQVIRRISRGNAEAETFFESIQAVPHYRIMYEMPFTGNWIDTIAPQWQILRDDLKYLHGKESDVDFSKNIILNIRPAASFFRQIIQTRVLQLLWLNEIQHLTGNEMRLSPLELHILPLQNEVPDRYLIRASTIALAGALTGVGALCLHHVEDSHIPEHYKRNNRNISNLLNLESQMYKRRDPLAGSYAIDHYTIQWSRAILNSMQ